PLPQEPPEVPPARAGDADPPDGASERRRGPGAHLAGHHPSLVEEAGAPGVEGIGAVQRSQQAPVTGDERPLVHRRREVGAHELVARGYLAQPALALEPPPELGARK